MRRRRFMLLAASVFASPFLTIRRAGAGSTEELTAMHTHWRDFHAGSTPLVELEPPLKRGRSEWRKQLPDDAYKVLFKEDTERPGSSALNDEKRAGLFLCAACSLPLFTTAMKFESGTGWPSFFTAIPDHLTTKTDYKLIWPRTEYHCAKCGGHQGHVFDDGPEPTGQRWCNNGVALRFVPAKA